MNHIQTKKISTTLRIPKENSVILLNPNTTDVPPPKIAYFDCGDNLDDLCFARIRRHIDCDFVLIQNWADLSDQLEHGCKTVVFHVDMISNCCVYTTPVEFVESVRTITHFMPGAQDVRLGAVIKKDTASQTVRDLRKTSVHSVQLDVNDFSIESVVTGIKALLNDTPFWPAEILSELPGSVKKKTRRGPFKLTARQSQVLELIQQRGASNKVIARALGISESTVKLHVTEILKKYGVRNRTQLALFSPP